MLTLLYTLGMFLRQWAPWCRPGWRPAPSPSPGTRGPAPAAASGHSSLTCKLNNKDTLIVLEKTIATYLMFIKSINISWWDYDVKKRSKLQDLGRLTFSPRPQCHKLYMVTPLQAIETIFRFPEAFSGGMYRFNLRIEEAVSYTCAWGGGYMVQNQI